MRDGLQLVQTALLEAGRQLSGGPPVHGPGDRPGIGEPVLKALDPTQQLVGIVYQELVQLMGPVDHSLHFGRA